MLRGNRLIGIVLDPLDLGDLQPVALGGRLDHAKALKPDRPHVQQPELPHVPAGDAGAAADCGDCARRACFVRFGSVIMHTPKRVLFRRQSRAMSM